MILRLSCGHELHTGRLSADLTHPRRPLYCGECRENRELAEVVDDDDAG